MSYPGDHPRSSGILGRVIAWSLAAWLFTTLASGVMLAFWRPQLGHLTGGMTPGEFAWIGASYSSFTVSVLAAFVAGSAAAGGTSAPPAAPVTDEEPRGTDSQQMLQAGLEEASRHLLSPTYIVDYAKSRNTDLDIVHQWIKQGTLSSYRYKGILFVGEKRPG